MPAQLETDNQESRNCISSGFFCYNLYDFGYCQIMPSFGKNH